MKSPGRRRTRAPQAPAPAAPQRAEAPALHAAPRAERAEGPAGDAGLLGLQRAAGNRAVSRAVQSAHVEEDGGRDVGAGEPLAPPVRAFFEARLGQDLRDVRVHRGAAAERAAADAGAAAFAKGSRVVFGRGQYAPETRAGRRLIGHELAHVVQQRAGGGDGPGSPAMERAAERASRASDPGGGRVAVQGRARVGVARAPRSLGKTLDPTSLSPSELREEVREIRQWLADHPLPTRETQLLRDALPALEARLREWRPPGDWAGFAPRFNRHFSSVLHAFRGAGASGEKSLSPERLRTLFTEAQREKLEDFMATGRIPERLFNGDEPGTATAQQRILISALILARGHYRPGSFEQRVHARMCWHWAQTVHHYAGVTPAGGGVAAGVMGSFDVQGGIVMGSGKPRQIYKGSRVYAGDLPFQEVAGDVGPVDPSTGHGETTQKEREKLEADPEAKKRVFRSRALPFDRFGEIRPGDWLYVYNANRSDSGGHSVIFSHWAGDVVEPETPADGPRYRVAVLFSQASQDSGGNPHRSRLGDQFSAKHRVSPVTYVGRVRPEARPATRPAQLFPGGSPRVAKRNAEFLKKLKRGLKKPVDVERLKDAIRAQNQAGIITLAPRLTEGQQAMLEEANEAYSLETLVRLHQRLRALRVNTGVLERNMAATNAQKNAEHKAAVTRIAAEEDAAASEIAGLESGRRSLQEDIRDREERWAHVDLAPRIRAMEKEMRNLQRDVERLRAGPARDELRRTRDALKVQMAALRLEQKARQGHLRSIAAELKALRRMEKGLARKHTGAVRRQGEIDRTMPYGLMHPGPLKGQIKESTTGLLQDLVPQPEWRDLVTSETALDELPETVPKIEMPRG